MGYPGVSGGLLILFSPHTPGAQLDATVITLLSLFRRHDDPDFSDAQLQRINDSFLPTSLNQSTSLLGIIGIICLMRDSIVMLYRFWLMGFEDSTSIDTVRIVQVSFRMRTVGRDRSCAGIFSRGNWPQCVGARRRSAGLPGDTMRVLTW